MIGCLANINWFWQPLCDAVIEPALMFINIIHKLRTGLIFFEPNIKEFDISSFIFFESLKTCMYYVSF